MTKEFFSTEDFLRAFWGTVPEMLTPAAAIVIVAGLAVALLRCRQDPFARITLVLFVWIFAGLLFTGAGYNPDWHAWLIIPFTSVFLYGLLSLFLAARLFLPRGPAILLFAVLCFLIARGEHELFFKGHLRQRLEPPPVPALTSNQLAAVFADLPRDLDGCRKIFLPARDFPEKEGGFDFSSLDRIEPNRSLLEHIIRFSDRDGLLQSLDEEFEKGGRDIRVYLARPSACNPDCGAPVAIVDELVTRYAGKHEMRLYGDILPIPIPYDVVSLFARSRVATEEEAPDSTRVSC